MKPDGTQHCDGQKPREGWEPRSYRTRRPQKGKGHKTQYLFTDKDNQCNHTYRQKSRDFAHGVQPTNVRSIKAGNLNNKIVQKCGPNRKGQRHGNCHQIKQRFGLPPFWQAINLIDGNVLIHVRRLSKGILC